VRDLTHTISQFPAPELIISGAGQAGAADQGGVIALEEAAPEQVFQAGSLADLIMNRVQPASWAPELGTSIEERNGKLVVMQKPEVHRIISQLLQRFREAQTLQVMVQSRFVEVRESFLEDIGVDFADLPNGVTSPSMTFGGSSWNLDPMHPFAPTGSSTGMVYSDQRGVPGYPTNHEYDYWVRSTSFNNRLYPYGSRLPYSTDPGSGEGGTFQFRFVGNVVAQAILHALKKEEHGDLLLAPRLTMYNNQRAYVMSVIQHPYIADYDVAGVTYDPVLNTIMTGTILDVKPTVSHDRRYVTLTMQPSTADQLDWETQYIVGAGVYPIQLPNIRLRSVRTTVIVPDGGSVLLSGLMTDVTFNSAAGVPFFSDLPILGRLFGSDLKQREKINLIVLVTTKLILFEEEEAKL
jgi:general secretion pathway protein D